MAVTFSKQTPNLVVADLARSLTFYRDVLGFSIIETVPKEAPYVFAMLDRDGIAVFLNAVAVVREDPAYSKLADEVGKGGVALYFDVKGVRELYDALQGKVNMVAPLERKFYGVTEFNITDPDGYLITFAERLD
jgi:catechol 2,3-dioxygenase-like lactoylglutathione lyase family enzyme